MNSAIELDAQSYVLLRLGDRRFAVAAERVAELVPPSRVFRFPHRTPQVEGVILRRGRIVPVCDVAEGLTGKRLTSRRFYLLALRRYATGMESVALPVTGDCELIAAEMTPASGDHPEHVQGWISHDGEVIEVLELDHLIPGRDANGMLAETAPAQESRR